MAVVAARWHALMALVYAASIIVVVACYATMDRLRAFVVPVYLSKTLFNATLGTPMSPESTLVGTLNIALLMVAFLLVTCHEHVYQSMVSAIDHASGGFGVIGRGNRARWPSYAVSATVMLLAISLLSGVVDLATLCTIAGANFGAMILGHASEDRESLLAYWGSWIAHLIAWIPTMLQFAQTGVDAPWFVWVIIILMVVAFMSFAVTHTVFRFCCSTARYEADRIVRMRELAYLFESAFAKLPLVMLVIGTASRFPDAAVAVANDASFYAPYSVWSACTLAIAVGVVALQTYETARDKTTRERMLLGGSKVIAVVTAVGLTSVLALFVMGAVVLDDSYTGAGWWMALSIAAYSIGQGTYLAAARAQVDRGETRNFTAIVWLGTLLSALAVCSAIVALLLTTCPGWGVRPVTVLMFVFECVVSFAAFAHAVVFDFGVYACYLAPRFRATGYQRQKA